MRREYECNRHQTNNQCPELSLMPLDYATSHNSTENEYYWQDICKCSNCILYEHQPTSINQSKMFDFDAIQVMENEELQQLSEAVNKEIVKNSEEIVFEEEEKASERNMIKLNDVKRKLLSYNQDMFFEKREEDILIQKERMERDIINKENKGDNQESFEGEKEDASLQATLIRLNKDKILKDSNQKIWFKKERKDFSERCIKLKEEADIFENSQEIVHEDAKDGFLKRNIIWLNEKDAHNLKNCQEVSLKQKKGVLERKLVKFDEGNDIMNNYNIYEEQLAFIKVKENPKDIRHLIRHTLYNPKEEYKMRSNEFAKKDCKVCLEKRQKLHNKKCKLIMSVNRDQKNTEKNGENNIFIRKEQTSQKRFDRSLSDDLLTTNDKRSFKESRNRNNKLILSINQNKNLKRDPFSIEGHISSKKHQRSFTDSFVTTGGRKSKDNAISNMKNVRILEEGQKSLQQIPAHKYSVASLNNLNSNSVFDQQLNYDFLKQENSDSSCQIKQHDNIRIENEKTMRKSSCHRPKITIHDKLYSNDIRSLNSPEYDLSPESGFCEQNLESNYKEMFTRNMKDVKNTNFIESNLSQENTISDIENLKENIKNHSVEELANINNIIVRN